MTSLSIERAIAVQAFVAARHQQPGQRRLCDQMELAQLLPGGHEGVLRDLFCLFRVAKDAGGVGIDGTCVPPIQQLEGSPVALGRAPHELTIVAGQWAGGGLPAARRTPQNLPHT